MKLAFYKGTRKGLQGLYSRLTRWVDSGPYSHCEIIFNDGLSASSSFIDGGVRFKQIDYKEDNWDFVELPDYLESQAREWFEEHEGDKYDVLGNLRFVLFFVKPSKNKHYCNEAVSDSLGFKESWRLGPNGFASLFKSRLFQLKDKQGLHE